MYLWQCFLVALVHGLGTMDGKFFGQTLVQEPLILAVLTGLVLGDVRTGIIIGAQLQVIFMGFVGIGYSALPNAITGSVLATAFCIMSNIDMPSAIALAMPIAMLFQPTKTLNRIANDILIPPADNAAAEGNDKKLAAVFWMGTLISFLIAFVPVFIAVYFGAEAVESLISAIPAVIMNALNKAGTILPALGLGLLMNFLGDRNTMPFILLGFILAAYLGMNALAIAALSGIIAFIYYNVSMQKKQDAEV